MSLLDTFLSHVCIQAQWEKKNFLRAVYIFFYIIIIMVSEINAFDHSTDQ